MAAFASVLKRYRSHARRVLDEAVLHAARGGDRSSGPRVVAFPTGRAWDAASNLRVWLMVPELRRLGWRVTVVPPSLDLAQRRRVVALEKPDVIFMQQTRHPLNRPELYAPVPVVLDADDADYLDPRHHDMIAKAAGNARAVVGGSRFLMECLGRHNADASCIWTCTPRPLTRPAVLPVDRPPVVAWAHATPLAYKEEAALVQEAIARAAERTPFTFWLFGSTERDAASWFKPLRQAGATCVAIPPLAYDAYLAKVAASAIGLQPVAVESSDFSRGKSFGKILAYLAGEVAVVASDAVDHPLFFRSGDNGVLVENTVPAWADAIERLVREPQLRGRIAAQGRADFLTRLTTASFARLLDPILRRAGGLAELRAPAA
jgi:hypothetical protein